jgi:large subunit ribosomal protein L4
VKLNAKVKTLAKASALSHKAANGTLKVVEDFTFDAPKTKNFLQVLDNMELSDQKSLFVTNDYDSNLYLSSRNLPNAKVMNAKDLNVYEILHSNTLVLSEGSVNKIVELFA